MLLIEKPLFGVSSREARTADVCCVNGGYKMRLGSVITLWIPSVSIARGIMPVRHGKALRVYSSILKSAVSAIMQRTCDASTSSVLRPISSLLPSNSQRNLLLKALEPHPRRVGHSLPDPSCKRFFGKWEQQVCLAPVDHDAGQPSPQMTGSQKQSQHCKPPAVPYHDQRRHSLSDYLDPELLVRASALLKSDLQAFLEQNRLNASRDNADLAHKIISSAQILGFYELARSCQRYEALARSQSCSDMMRQHLVGQGRLALQQISTQFGTKR
jgi:HPt (histidine-containing phosphotransfer) domain-containing protein